MKPHVYHTPGLGGKRNAEINAILKRWKKIPGLGPSKRQTKTKVQI